MVLTLDAEKCRAVHLFKYWKIYLHEDLNLVDLYEMTFNLYYIDRCFCISFKFS